MADFSLLTGQVMKWMQTGLFWLILAGVLTFACILFLYFNKKRKLKYELIEIIPFGNGKIGINKGKAGIFKMKSMLFGLIDYGIDFKFKTADNRVIADATTRDLQDIYGKKGFIVTRKVDDPKILVPLNKFEVKNKWLLGEIAPADFRDASVSILAEATKETQGWVEKYLPYIMLAGIVIFFILSMILATQFFNRTVDKAGEILLKAGSQAGNVVPAGGNAP